MNDPLTNQLDAYLDGTLSEAERVAFEHRLKDDPALRAAAQQQGRINEALKRAIPQPSSASLQAALLSLKTVSHPVSPAGVQVEPADAPPMRVSWRRRFAIAAVLACVLVGAWQFRAYYFPSNGRTGNSSSLPPVVLISPEEYYAIKLAKYEPYWVCENDQQFAQTFRDRFGQAILLKALPANITCKGLDYCQTLSDDTVAALMYVDGKEVIALIDGADSRAMPTLASGCQLHVFQRRVGDLVVIEISPYEQPRVMDLFYNPDKAGPADPNMS